jgi:hypothetical protein
VRGTTLIETGPVDAAAPKVRAIAKNYRDRSRTLNTNGPNAGGRSAGKQGWTRAKTATGPIKYLDENGVTPLSVKSGSPRAPGSNFPHAEVRNATGQRVDPYGNAVTRRSPGNHTPIEWDLP